MGGGSVRKVTVFNTSYVSNMINLPPEVYATSKTRSRTPWARLPRLDSKPAINYFSNRKLACILTTGPRTGP